MSIDVPLGAGRSNSDPRSARYHVEFRQVLLEVSTELIGRASEDIAPGIERALERIGRFVGCDLCGLFLFSEDRTRFRLLHGWATPVLRGKLDQFQAIRGSTMPWGHERRLRGETVVIPDVDRLPEDAALDRASFQALDLRSVVDVPLNPGHDQGFLGFGASSPRIWTEDEVSLLALVARMLANVLGLRQALDAAHDSEERFKAAAMCSIDVLADADASRSEELRFYGDIAKLLGIPPSKIPRTSEELVSYQIPEDLEQTRRKMAHAIATGDDYFNKSRYRRGDGSVIHCEVRARAIRFEKGKPSRWIVAYTDVTERHRADEELRQALKQLAVLRDRLQAENIYLLEEIDRSQDYHRIVGQSPAIQKLLSQVHQVAPTDSTVLMLGDTGTGKELFAHAIHRQSSRRNRPLVRVNCAALPESVVESELFGHEKGAFTGAIADRVGRFELADGGTLFLDEIGDLSLEVQAKLLRVLQEGEFERVGSSQTRRADVRLIVATHRDLEASIESGYFRRDLYYRLSVFPLVIPPLRERREDIPDLVRHFVERLSKRTQKRILSIPDPVLQALQAYDWPGNVRELQNVVERAMILSTDTELVLPEFPRGAARDPREGRIANDSLEDLERTHIERTLEACFGRIKGAGNAAERLGLKPSTLYSRMKRLGIERPNHRH